MCKQIAPSYASFGISRCSNTFPIDGQQLKCSPAGATSCPSTQIHPESSPNSNNNNSSSFPLPHSPRLRRRLSLRRPILQPLAALWPRPFPRITPPTPGTAPATDRGHPVVISTWQTSLNPYPARPTSSSTFPATQCHTTNTTKLTRTRASRPCSSSKHLLRHRQILYRLNLPSRL